MMKKNCAILFLISALALSSCGRSKASDLPASSHQSAYEADPEEELSDISGSADTESPNTTDKSGSDDISASETISVIPEYAEGSEEKKLQNYVVNIIIENYANTTIEAILVNEYLRTEEGGDYILLVNLIWEQENSGAASGEVLAMYSSDFAARIETDQPSVKKVAIFWTVPYLDNASAKWTYERLDSGMQLSGKLVDDVFSQ